METLKLKYLIPKIYLWSNNFLWLTSVGETVSNLIYVLFLEYWRKYLFFCGGDGPTLSESSLENEFSEINKFLTSSTICESF